MSIPWNDVPSREMWCRGEKAVLPILPVSLFIGGVKFILMERKKLRTWQRMISPGRSRRTCGTELWNSKGENRLAPFTGLFENFMKNKNHFHTVGLLCIRVIAGRLL